MAGNLSDTSLSRDPSEFLALIPKTACNPETLNVITLCRQTIPFPRLFFDFAKVAMASLALTEIDKYLVVEPIAAECEAPTAMAKI
jgi:hypothetical protein